MKYYIITFALLAVSVFAGPVDSPKAIRDKAIAATTNAWEEGMADVVDALRADLAAAEAELQKQGDLDNLLLLKTLQQSMSKGIPADAVWPNTVRVNAIRNKYLLGLNKLEADKAKAVILANKAYVVELEALKKKLTVAGKISEAIQVDKELKAIVGTVSFSNAPASVTATLPASKITIETLAPTYHVVNGKLYRFIRSRPGMLFYNDGNYNLITITSASENAIVAAVLESVIDAEIPTEINRGFVAQWISYLDLKMKKGRWVWGNGTAATYQNWCEGDKERAAKYTDKDPAPIVGIDKNGFWHINTEAVPGMWGACTLIDGPAASSIIRNYRKANRDAKH